LLTIHFARQHGWLNVLIICINIDPPLVFH
jgi:hypothetical protein